MRAICLRLSKCLALLGWRALLAVISSSAPTCSEHVVHIVVHPACPRAASSAANAQNDPQEIGVRRAGRCPLRYRQSGSSGCTGGQTCHRGRPGTFLRWARSERAPLRGLRPHSGTSCVLGRRLERREGRDGLQGRRTHRSSSLCRRERWETTASTSPSV